RARLARLVELGGIEIDRDDLRAAHEPHPLNREEADRPASDDRAALTHRGRRLPYRMQRDRSRVGHGDGARISSLRRLEKVPNRRGDEFGVSPITPAAEIIIVSAAGEIAGHALVADAARKHWRDADELANVEPVDLLADLDDFAREFVPADDRHAMRALGQ